MNHNEQIDKYEIINQEFHKIISKLNNKYYVEDILELLQEEVDYLKDYYKR